MKVNDIFVVVDSVNGNTITEREVELRVEEATAESIRQQRDVLLELFVDKVAGNSIRWEAMSDVLKQKWRDYRQSLLDIPEQTGFPADVNWPSPPPTS